MELLHNVILDAYVEGLDTEQVTVRRAHIERASITHLAARSALCALIVEPSPRPR